MVENNVFYFQWDLNGNKLYLYNNSEDIYISKAKKKII